MTSIADGSVIIQTSDRVGSLDPVLVRQSRPDSKISSEARCPDQVKSSMSILRGDASGTMR